MDQKGASSYQPPVSELLKLGQPGGREAGEEGWDWREVEIIDYARVGFGPEHADELMRLMMDRSLMEEDEPAYFGPVHAARALASLRIERALPRMIELVRLLDRLGHEGWLEDMPRVLAAFGPAAVAHIARALRDQREKFGVRLFLTDALEKIGKQDEQARGAAARVLKEMLAYARFTDPAVVGHVVGAMLELKVVESLPMIKAAYEAGWVDETCCGRYSEVEEEMRMTAEELAAKRERVSEEIRAKWGEWEEEDFEV